MLIKEFCEKLLGKTFNSLLKQFDMLIVNFDEPITYSLHVNCMFRICKAGKIILTNADEFFTRNCEPKTDSDYEKLEKNGIINDSKSLLSYNIKKASQILKGKQVKNIKITKWKDLVLSFDDNIYIQIIPDCLMRNYEFYRCIEFLPNWSENLNVFKSIHYIVYNYSGKVSVKIEQ